MALDPMLVGFLVEIGRWAKSELSERWKLKRNQDEIDLTDKQQVEEIIPQHIQSLVVEKTELEVERALSLIQRRRDIIYTEREAKLADQQQLARRQMLQSEFEQLEKQHNRVIRRMLDEISDDLSDLGFEVKRTET